MFFWEIFWMVFSLLFFVGLLSFFIARFTIGKDLESRLRLTVSCFATSVLKELNNLVDNEGKRDSVFEKSSRLIDRFERGFFHVDDCGEIIEIIDEMISRDFFSDDISQLARQSKEEIEEQLDFLKSTKAGWLFYKFELMRSKRMALSRNKDKIIAMLRRQM